MVLHRKTKVLRQQLPKVLLMVVAAALLLLSSCASASIPDSSTEQPLEMAPETPATATPKTNPSPPQTSHTPPSSETEPTSDTDKDILPKIKTVVQRRGKLPVCESEPIFTASPIDVKYIMGIIPLGNMNPPSHTFPTDHIYFHITRQDGADRPDTATVYSPGDLTVTQVWASEHVKAGFADYNIFLKPCDDITVMFYHVSSLSRDIFGDTSSFTTWHLDSEYATGGETYRTWSKRYSINVKAGDILGMAGGNRGQWAMDLGVYDRRYRPEKVANPQRWQSRYLNTVCPFKYFEEGPVLAQLLALVQRDKVEGESLPCGSILQDMPGTAQGIWFLSGVNETYPEDHHLALVRSNILPARAVLSVGNSITNLRSDIYDFLPKNAGRLNRDFRDIAPDGQTYGFQVNQFEGVIILQMVDTETIWIQAIREATGNPTNLVFSDDKTVFVR